MDLSITKSTQWFVFLSIRHSIRIFVRYFILFFVSVIQKIWFDWIAQIASANDSSAAKLQNVDDKKILFVFIFFFDFGVC